MRAAMFALVAALIAVPAQAQEMSEAQKEAWNALEEQVALEVEKDWAAMRQYLHPSLSLWGERIPTPVSLNDTSYRYFIAVDENVVVREHYLAPVSVMVVDDVAIINCYSHALVVNDEGDEEEIIYRLHNTWKKHEGRWKLLATYNTVVQETPQ